MEEEKFMEHKHDETEVVEFKGHWIDKEMAEHLTEMHRQRVEDAHRDMRNYNAVRQGTTVHKVLDLDKPSKLKGDNPCLEIMFGSPGECFLGKNLDYLFYGGNQNKLLLLC